MIVRRAGPADAEDLARLHGASFGDGWSVQDFETWLGRAESFAVVAAHGGEARGFGLALAAGEDAELLTIAVLSQYRRGGLARRVFCALDDEARKRGLRRWVLEVARNNLPAIGLYKSQGFVEIAVRTAYYRQTEGRVDAIFLSCSVGSGGGHATA